MRTTWTFHAAGQLIFGMDAVKQLGEVARRRNWRRVFCVTDRPLVAAGLFDAVREPLEAGGAAVELFDGGEVEPPLEMVDTCAAAARAWAPDAVLGLGGGSNMDLAKSLALVLAHGGTIRDYIGDDRVPGPIVPVVCVPTTAGTGSEVSAAAVLTDSAQKVKVGVLSNMLRPAVAVVDPRLAVNCPAKVTADSGIDALAHAIEAFTAVDNADFPLPAGERTVYQGRTPLGDALAEKAIALVGRHLVQAVRQPDDLAARAGMALAATLAGLAFSNVGVALVHAMEYPVGGAVHCSHGAGNGLLLPLVMRYNLPERVAEMARIAALLGEDVSGLEQQAAAERAIDAVARLNAAVGIPARLRELGVTREQLPAFAAKAAGIERILRVNPRAAGADDILAIYEAAW